MTALRQKRSVGPSIWEGETTRSRQSDGIINEENRPTIHLVYNYGCSLGMRHKRLAMIILPLTLNTCPAELQRTKDGAIATTEQRRR